MKPEAPKKKDTKPSAKSGEVVESKRKEYTIDFKCNSNSNSNSNGIIHKWGICKFKKDGTVDWDNIDWIKL